jgi:glycosyltransferase involved in cell wall biosynthesis
VKVSVVTTVKNEQDTIGEYLRGLAGQSLTPDEVVIVDGGSDDGTVDAIRRQDTAGMTVKVIEEPGVNIARGRNIGIAGASHDIIAVTDSGCRPDENWLQNLVAPFEEPGIDVVGGAVLGDPRTPFEECVAETVVVDPAIFDEEKFHPISRNIAFRKAAWEKVGGYPEWLYCAEDTLFSVFLREAGCRIRFAPDARVYWRPRSTIRQLFKQYYLYGVGNGRANLFPPEYGRRIASHSLGLFAMLVLILARSLWLWAAFAIAFILYLHLRCPRYGKGMKRYLTLQLVRRVRYGAEMLGYAMGTVQRLAAPRSRRMKRRILT